MRRLRSMSLAAMLCAALARTAGGETSPHAAADTSGSGQDARAFIEASRPRRAVLGLGGLASFLWSAAPIAWML